MKEKINPKNYVSNKYYLIKYCGGWDIEDRYSTVIFVTDKKSIATEYCAKFNKILKKWKDYYKQFETKGGFRWIEKEHADKHFDRWYNLRNIKECYYEEVFFR